MEGKYNFICNWFLKEKWLWGIINNPWKWRLCWLLLVYIAFLNDYFPKKHSQYYFFPMKSEKIGKELRFVYDFYITVVSYPFLHINSLYTKMDKTLGTHSTAEPIRRCLFLFFDPVLPNWDDRGAGEGSGSGYILWLQGAYPTTMCPMDTVHVNYLRGCRLDLSRA